MVRIRDVADAVGVSVSTVSRALNGKPGYCSPETRQRIRDAAEDLGYQPSCVARALVIGRTNTVAIACEAPDDPHGTAMLAAAHATIQRYGFDTILSPYAPHGPADELERMLRERRADVLLYARGYVGGAEYLLNARSAPHQLVIAASGRGDHVPGGLLCACWDDRKGIGLGLQHLVGLGHRRIAYLSGATLHAKALIVQAEASKLGVEVIPIITGDERDRLAAGRAMASQALALSPRPTAIMARGDEFALGALFFLQEAGVRVPHEMSLMGYLGLPALAHTHPPITTVYTPFLECAVHVLTIALDHLTSGSTGALQPRSVEFPPRLMARASTAPPP